MLCSAQITLSSLTINRCKESLYNYSLQLNAVIRYTVLKKLLLTFLKSWNFLKLILISLRPYWLSTYSSMSLFHVCIFYSSFISYMFKVFNDEITKMTKSDEIFLLIYFQQIYQIIIKKLCCVQYKNNIIKM